MVTPLPTSPSVLCAALCTVGAAKMLLACTCIFLVTAELPKAVINVIVLGFGVLTTASQLQECAQRRTTSTSPASYRIAAVWAALPLPRTTLTAPLNTPTSGCKKIHVAAFSVFCGSTLPTFVSCTFHLPGMKLARWHFTRGEVTKAAKHLSA